MEARKPHTPGTPPRSNPLTPSRLVPITPIDRGRRPPRLVLPNNGFAQPQINSSPYPNSVVSSNPNGSNPYFQHSEFVSGLKGFAKSGLSIGEKSTLWLYHKLSTLSKKWFTHCFLSIVLALYTVGGAVLFSAVEGGAEDVVRLNAREMRYQLITELRELSLYMPMRKSDGEWEANASLRLIEFEDYVIEAYKNKALIATNRGTKIWTFFNSVVYCATIFTTIGYGHIYPTTTTGQALTIVYAIIGIPLFLIALTDFGKLFTRGIKFLWSFVRRVYYTGSCRRVRKTTQVENILHGAQMVYDIARFRRPSFFNQTVPDPENPKTNPESSPNSAAIGTDTPTTPAPSNFEIDDEFNLPISLAIFILVLYMFLGAVMYWFLESWDFFGSFYFVFISMSTIGFGDYVPTNAICMIASIVYLVFGLALMSMCINVVQVKLSDTFADASTKLGATIGLSVDEEDGSVQTPIEVPDIHVSDDKEDLDTADKKGDGKKEIKSSLKLKSEDKEDEEEEDPKSKRISKEVKF